MAWDTTGNAGTNPNANFLGTADNQPLVVKTNNVEALRIQPGTGAAAGYVGIGTTNPSNALTVVSDDDGHGISLIGSATGGPQGRPRAAGITFVDDTADRGHLGLACAPNAFMMGIAPGDMLVNATTGILHLGAGDAFQTPALHVMQGGHVGIGTTNATQELTVAGQGFFLASSASPDPGDGSGTGIRIGYQSNDDYAYINANTTGVAAKPLLLQQNGGNVGIGTPSNVALPFGRLEVRSAGTNSYGIISRGDPAIYAQNIDVEYNRAFLATTVLAADFYGNVQCRNDVIVDGVVAAGSLMFPDGTVQKTASKGPKGDQGNQGNPGPKGDKGDRGAPGARRSTAVCGPTPCAFACSNGALQNQSSPCVATSNVLSKTKSCETTIPGQFCCVCR